MESPNVPSSWVAEPGSDEEHELLELLELLDVITMSFSLNGATCVEGFEYLGLRRDNSTTVGCGSPNYFTSAFAGSHATQLRALLRDKAYLTVQDINVMGFHYGIRENCISGFTAILTNSGRINVVYTIIINFSTHGQFYALQIVNNVLFMVVNLLSVLQIGLVLVIPAFRLKTPHAVDNFLREGYASFLECSLYCSLMIIAMTVTSQLLLWLLALPNSVIWTWGNSNFGKIQAYLSSLRLWTLVLLVIAKYMFLTTAEIITIGAAVSYWNRQKIFVIELQIDELQLQRQLDMASFHRLNGSMLWILYKPLLTILVSSVLAVFEYAALKFCVYYWMSFGRNRHRNSLVATADVPQSHDQLEEPNGNSSNKPRTLQKSLSAESSSRCLGTFIHFAHIDRSFVTDHPCPRGEYSQLPLEILINKPIRASLELDHIVNHERFVSARLYLEFGIFFVDGRMKPRWGFPSPIPPLLQVDHNVISDMVRPLIPRRVLAKTSLGR